MTTTEPQAMTWMDSISPAELRKDADEILEGLDSIESDLIDLLVRAQRFAVCVDDHIRDGREVVRRHLGETVGFVDGDVDDAVSILIRSLSGSQALWATLYRLADLCHPETVLAGSGVEVEAAR